MRFQDYWNVFVRRWPVVVVLVVAVTVASGVYSKMQTKIYRANATVSVRSVKFDYGQGLAAAQLLNLFSLQLRRTALVTQVDQQLRLDLAPQAMRGEITVTPSNQDLTELIQVDDPDAQRAAAIATGLAQAFSQQVTAQQQALQAQDRIDVSVLEPAHVPTAPNRPKTKVNVAVGGLVGLILGVLVAFGVDALDDSLKTADDVDATLGLPVLGTIPRFGAGRHTHGMRRSAVGPSHGAEPATVTERAAVGAGSRDRARR